MPKIVKVYDPARNPPEWNRLLTGPEGSAAGNENKRSGDKLPG